ncbi:MAG: class I SAM-dependent methyltransferase [Ilumatobacteraceae bacterium]
MSTALDRQLLDTAEAFDSVAASYDGPQGNNELIQRMRAITWARIESLLPSGPAWLIDIGCGTGIDAEHFAALGHHVVATDWSPAMVERAAARAPVSGTAGSVRAERVGAQELDRLASEHMAAFDVAYSNFGPLNCVPDLSRTAADLALLMRPGGHAVLTVMGRWCPWEIAHYARRRRWARARVRFSRRVMPVGMNGHTIWTRYFTPREFAREWLAGGGWEVVSYEGLSTFVPPPYLDALATQRPRLFRRLVRLDARTAAWPVLRTAGDHFLIVLRRR